MVETDDVPAYDGPAARSPTPTSSSSTPSTCAASPRSPASGRSRWSSTPGNGMGGLTVPIVFDGLPLDVVPLYFELDGTFPNHEANPIDPANLRDLQAAVRRPRRRPRAGARRRR